MSERLSGAELLAARLYHDTGTEEGAQASPGLKESVVSSPDAVC